VTPEDEHFLAVVQDCPSFCPMLGQVAWWRKGECQSVCPLGRGACWQEWEWLSGRGGLQEVVPWVEGMQSGCHDAGLVSCFGGNGFCCDDRPLRWSVGFHRSEPPWRVGGWKWEVVPSQRMT
jgi:hypothetical protein